MLKSEFVAAVAAKTDTTKKHAEEMIEGVVACIIDALNDGEDLALRGLGTFKIKEKPGRTCHNPQNGEPVEVPAHNVIKFAPAAALKESVR